MISEEKDRLKFCALQKKLLISSIHCSLAKYIGNESLSKIAQSQ